MFQLYASKVNLDVDKNEMEVLTSGSQNVYTCQFRFSSSWDGFSRTAVFSTRAVRISVPLGADNTCQIPHEVLLQPKTSLYVGLYGTRNGTVVLTTTRACLGEIQQGTTPGVESQAPTPDVYAQILELANEAQETAKKLQLDAETGVFEAGGLPLGGVAGEIPVKQSGANFDVLWQDAKTIAGATGDPGGYYKLSVQQSGANSMSISYTPSQEGMPQISKQRITLPYGPQGAPGPAGPVGPSGPMGPIGRTPIKGVDYWTQEDIEELLSYGLLPTFVDSVEEMTDQSKSYVLTSDGFIYTYGTKDIVQSAVDCFQNSGYELNKRQSTSSVSAMNGYVVSGLIPVQMYTASPYILRVQGLTPAQMANATAGNNRIGYYDMADVQLGQNYFNYPEVSGRAVAVEMDGEDYLIKIDTAATTVSSTAVIPDRYASTQIRICFAINSTQTPITDADVSGIRILREADNSIETVTGWHSTGLSYTPADYSETVAALETSMATLSRKVRALESASEEGAEDLAVLPDYWQAEIDAISDTMAARQAGGHDCFQFVWFSDIHGTTGYPNTNGAGTSSQTHLGAIARQLCQQYQIPLTAVSGDIMSQSSHPDEAMVHQEYRDCSAILSVMDPGRLLLTIGNHDGSWGTPVDEVYYLKDIGNRALYNHVFRRQAGNLQWVFGPEGTYFYVDDAAQKVRFVMLNTHTDGDGANTDDGYALYNSMKTFVFGSTQLQWLEEEALDVGGGWLILLMGHTPVGNVRDGALLAGILQAYQEKTAYTGGTVDLQSTYWGSGLEDSVYNTSQTLSKDFSAAGGEIAAYFHGHLHCDIIDTTALPCPSIGITTAGGDVRDTEYTVERVPGTATETALDIVTVDRAARKIHMTRLGAGLHREVSY